MEETIDRAAAIAELGLTVESVFVPFSQSRNKNEKHKSMNWKVTVKRNGREVLTTDYSAGIAHCPAKAARAPSGWRAPDRRRADGTCYPGTSSNYRRATEAESLAHYLDEWRAAECESGVAMEYSPFIGEVVFKPKRVRDNQTGATKTQPILPDPLDVLYSLTMDSSVLDHATFESWASEFGYDVDSRSAESTYRACLDIALKMRAALGDSGMERLAEIFQDY